MFLSRRNKVWYVYHTDPETGKRKKISTGAVNKSDALKELKSIAENLSRCKKAPDLLNFQNQVIEHLQPLLAPGTVTIYRKTFSKFIKVAGNIVIDRINQYHVDRFKSESMKRLMPSTVNIDLRTLRAAFSYAVRWGYIACNPFTKVKLVPLIDTAPNFYTPEEFTTFIKTIHEKWFRDVVLCAAMTGLRRSELVNLRWKHVDFQRAILLVQSSGTFRTKMGKRRIVPMNQFVVKLFQEIDAGDSEDFVFRYKDIQINPKLLTHKLKDAMMRAKMDRAGIHFHSLRHTFASWLVQRGVSIYAVKELLGHSDVKITQIYSHLSGSELHNEVSKLPIIIEHIPKTPTRTASTAIVPIL